MSYEKPKLKDLLSPYLENSLKSYQSFLMEDSPTDAKGFTAYHNACKAVLSHVCLLLKMIEEPINENEKSESTLTDLIKKARSAPELQEDTDADFE